MEAYKVIRTEAAVLSFLLALGAAPLRAQPGEPRAAPEQEAEAGASG